MNTINVDIIYIFTLVNLEHQEVNRRKQVKHVKECTEEKDSAYAVG